MKSRRSPTLILTALAFAATAVAVMQTVVAPILPQMQEDMNVSSSAIAWVLTGNLLAAAVATPLVGRLGDLRGKKRYLSIALLAVTAGSLLAAVSTTFPVLIAGRILQGIGGGTVPLALSIVRDEFPKERTAGSIAVIGATISVGATFGSVMTGVVADHADYHLLFWLSALVAAISLVLVRTLVPDGTGRREGRVDVVGAVALSGWLAALLAAVSQGSRQGWGQPFVLGGFTAAAALFAAWAWWSLRAPEPLVDLRVMTRRPILLANTSGMLSGVAMYGSSLLFAPFLQTPESRGYGFGATVLAAGIIMLPGALGNLAAAPVAGRLINRYGPRPALAAGPLLGGVSFALLVPLSGHVWAFSLVGLLFGFGIGLAFAAMPAVINANVPKDMTGVANGMNSVLRTVGGAVGTAILGAILSAITLPGGDAPSLTAYRVCFALLAIGCLIATVIAVMLPRPVDTAGAEPVEETIVRAGGPGSEAGRAAGAEGRQAKHDEPAGGAGRTSGSAPAHGGGPVGSDQAAAGR